MQLLIADDHPLIVKGLSRVLEETPAGEQTVIHTAASLPELQQVLENHGLPDVLLLDVRLGADDARTFLPGLLRTHCGLKVVAVTSMDDVATARMLMAQGVRGYVLKTDTDEELLRAIQAVHRGETFLSKELTAGAARQALLSNTKEHLPLTGREREVLKLILGEYSTKQIADELCISDKTVENHRSNLLLKFDVKNVAGLVRKAILEGFVA